MVLLQVLHGPILLMNVSKEISPISRVDSTSSMPLEASAITGMHSVRNMVVILISFNMVSLPKRLRHFFQRLSILTTKDTSLSTISR